MACSPAQRLLRDGEECDVSSYSERTYICLDTCVVDDPVVDNYSNNLFPSRNLSDARAFEI